MWCDNGFTGLANYEKGPREPSFKKAQQLNFSEELRTLVPDCMLYDASERPTFPEVLKRIRTYKNKLAQGLEFEPEGSEKWAQYELNRTSADAWAVGQKLSNAKELPEGRQFQTPPDASDWAAESSGDHFDAEIEFGRYDYYAEVEAADEDEAMEGIEQGSASGGWSNQKKVSSNAGAGAADSSSELSSVPEEILEPVTKSKQKQKKSSLDDEYNERPKARPRRAI